MLIDTAHIVPFYQPVVCVDTAEIYGYEVLGRYDLNGNMQSLGQFFHNPHISSQEKVIVDRIIRFKALEQIKELDGTPRLFLNIQPEWLQPFLEQNKVLPTIERMERQNIDGKQIIIEICEDQCNNIEVMMELTKRYREIGCRIAIDDVGEGFSNLERVSLLQPDFLKISADIITRSKNNNLLKSIGAFCERAGVSLVLETVETMDQFMMGLDAGVRFSRLFFGCSAFRVFSQKELFSYIKKRFGHILGKKIPGSEQTKSIY